MSTNRISLIRQIGESMRVISGKAKGTKLNSLEGIATRPTLDRVKEALFNILQFDLQDAIVLDLFAGSGALGIEALIRNAKQVVFCDNSYKAIQIIEKNLKKTNLNKNAIVINKDYKTCLKDLKEQFDIIFLDPPYKSSFAIEALEQIVDLNLLSKEGIIVIETDEENIEKEIQTIDINLYDIRKYGRVKLMFLNRKG